MSLDTRRVWIGAGERSETTPRAMGLPHNCKTRLSAFGLHLPVDLSTITAQFPGSDWQPALSADIRQSELDRMRAARLLHDEVGQLLSVAGLQLGVFLLDFPDAAPRLAEPVADIQSLLEDALAHVREVSRQLNPSSVERSGLKFALEYLIERTLPSFAGNLKLDYPLELRVPARAARALLPVAEYALDHALIRNAKNVLFKLNEEKFGWILEVLYDIASPKSVEEFRVNDRLSLLRLQYQAIRAGVPVVFGDAPEGMTLIRAIYAAQDESSAQH